MRRGVDVCADDDAGYDGDPMDVAVIVSNSDERTSILRRESTLSGVE